MRIFGTSRKPVANTNSNRIQEVTAKPITAKAKCETLNKKDAPLSGKQLCNRAFYL